MQKIQKLATHEAEHRIPKRQTILLIDDNEEILTLLKTVLELDDHHVVTASTGAEGLSILSHIDIPDLILLDMKLEDMDGTDFLLLLESDFPKIFQAVPVVFLTGMDRVPVTKAVGFIRKPIDVDQFLMTIQGFIEAGTGVLN
jgi:CheY-like chemotaxis protein